MIDIIDAKTATPEFIGRVEVLILDALRQSSPTALVSRDEVLEEIIVDGSFDLREVAQHVSLKITCYLNGRTAGAKAS